MTIRNFCAKLLGYYSKARGKVLATADSKRAGAPRKTRIFLSYSRNDLDFSESSTDEFAKAFIQALVDCGYSVLIDKNDIAFGENWQARLGQLILEADTVLFFLSPNSLASKHCKWEAEEAESLGKRILPIVIKTVDPQSVPPVLSKLNFIFFENDPDQAFDHLLETLEADLPWLREHTRLGDLAQQWKSRRGNAGVLRGPALEDAERWIASQPRNAALATDMQRDFIAASRKAAASRQRNWILGSVFAAALAFALLGWGVLKNFEAAEQSERALTEQKRAEEQAVIAVKKGEEAETNFKASRLSEAKSIAEFARKSLSDGNIVNAVKLSLLSESLASESADKSFLSPLWRSASTMTQRFVIREEGSDDAFFVDNDKKVVFTDATGNISIFDMATKQMRPLFKNPDAKEFETQLDYYGIESAGVTLFLTEVSKDGRHLFWLDWRGNFRIWDTATEKIQAELKLMKSTKTLPDFDEISLEVVGNAVHAFVREQSDRVLFNISNFDGTKPIVKKVKQKNVTASSEKSDVTLSLGTKSFELIDEVAKEAGSFDMDEDDPLIDAEINDGVLLLSKKYLTASSPDLSGVVRIPADAEDDQFVGINAISSDEKLVAICKAKTLEVWEIDEIRSYKENEIGLPSEVPVLSVERHGETGQCSAGFSDDGSIFYHMGYESEQNLISVYRIYESRFPVLKLKTGNQRVERPLGSNGKIMLVRNAPDEVAIHLIPTSDGLELSGDIMPNFDGSKIWSKEAAPAKVKIWDRKTKRLLLDSVSKMGLAMVAPAAETILFYEFDKPTVELRKIGDSKNRKLRLPGPPVFLTDNNIIVISQPGANRVELVVVDFEGKTVARTPFEGELITSRREFSFSKNLYAFLSTQGAHVYDIENQFRHLLVVHGHSDGDTGPIQSIVVVPEMMWVATRSWNGELVVTDIKSGQRLCTIEVADFGKITFSKPHAKFIVPFSLESEAQFAANENTNGCDEYVRFHLTEGSSFTYATKDGGVLTVGDGGQDTIGTLNYTTPTHGVRYQWPVSIPSLEGIQFAEIENDRVIIGGIGIVELPSDKYTPIQKACRLLGNDFDLTEVASEFGLRNVRSICSEFTDREVDLERLE